MKITMRNILAALLLLALGASCAPKKYTHAYFLNQKYGNVDRHADCPDLQRSRN